MAQRLSYQFCQIFLAYNKRISEVPMDSNMLIFIQIRELPRGLAIFFEDFSGAFGFLC